MRKCRITLVVGLLLSACAASGPVASKEDMAEERALEAARLLASADEALDAEDATKAKTALSSARNVLDDPAAKRHPDRRFTLEELERKTGRLATLEKLLEKRAFEAERDAHLEKLDAATSDLTEVVKVLTREAGAVEAAAVQDAIGVRKTIATLIVDGMRYEESSSAYDRAAKRAQKAHDGAQSPITRAGDVRAFLDGPLAARTKAERLVESAGVEDDQTRRIELYVEARLEFKACARDASALARSAAHLERTKFAVGSGKLTPKKVVALCKRREGVTARVLEKLKRSKKKKKKKKG